MDITVNEAIKFAVLMGSFVTAIGVMYKAIRSGIKKVFDAQTKTILDKIETLSKKVDQTEQSVCKNYIVPFLSSVERGEAMDQIEILRFWEEYDLYKSAGGNSYIHDRVERLRKEGKL